MDRNERLLGVAAQWCARLGASDCSAAERAGFSRWLEDDAHRAAYEQVRRAGGKIELAIDCDARLRELAERAFAAGANISEKDETSISFQRRASPRLLERRSGATSSFRRVALAAGIVCAFVAAWSLVNLGLSRSSSSDQVVVLEAPQHSALHSTLLDGTIVHVDAGAKLRVSFSKNERVAELLAGRAYFEVAHDASRPFSVLANDTRTVALGTKFEVQSDPDVIVTLAEGSVAVSGEVNGSTWHEQLIPGEQLDVNIESTRRKLRTVDAGVITGWSRGRLEFRDLPLRDAVRDINRYSAKQVVIGDAELQQLRIAGSFIAGDAQSIVDAIAEVLPIRVVDGGSHEIILFKRYD